MPFITKRQALRWIRGRQHAGTLWKRLELAPLVDWDELVASHQSMGARDNSLTRARIPFCGLIH